MTEYERAWQEFKRDLPPDVDMAAVQAEWDKTYVAAACRFIDAWRAFVREFLTTLGLR